MKYLIFNKPYGVLCQFTDRSGRPTLKDYIDIGGVYAVGRLDIDSEGLLLLTDDGKLNELLSSPFNKQFKTYLAQVEGTPTEEMMKKLRSGILIQGSRTMSAQAVILSEPPALWPRTKPIRFRRSVPTSWIEIKICEGRNHQVKKMTAAVGLPCLRLIRTTIGPIELGGLKPGEYEEINRPQI